ncbi:MAG: hypothetical protein WAO19_08155 [Candidatus Kryptoniota bacterium]
MVQVDNRLLGKLSGLLGDVVFHYENRKTVNCRRSMSFVRASERFVIDLITITFLQTGFFIIIVIAMNRASVFGAAKAIAIELTAQSSLARVDSDKELNAKLVYAFHLKNLAKMLVLREQIVTRASGAYQALETWRY